jgi:hypothetical protein
MSGTKPLCYSKVVVDPWWKAAMGKEFDALLSNGTWSICIKPLKPQSYSK